MTAVATPGATDQITMHERVAAFDWSRTPLGPRDAWPGSLRTAVGICLHSRFPMMIWWGAGLTQLYNDAYAEVLGKRHPDALGRSGRDVWADVWPVVGPDADAVMRRGESTWNERVLLVMERNGVREDTWFTWSYSPIYDEAGRVGGLFNTCREDTAAVLAERRLAREVEDRRQADERARLALEADRANLAAMIDKAPAFIATLRGPDHVFERANDPYYELIGRREILGKPVGVALPEVVGQGFVAVLDEVYRTGRPFIGREMLVLLDAAEGAAAVPRHVNFVFQALHGPDGGIAGIFIHGFDVTDLVRSRDAIRRSEERRRLALDAAELGSWNVDLASSAVTTDERFQVIFRGRPGALTYDEAIACIHPDDVAAVRASIARATRPLDPVPHAIEHRVVRPDGTVRWAQVRGRATFAGEGGERHATSFDGTIADVTDRRQAEADLRASEQRYRALVDAGTDIAYRMSADWSTMLPLDGRRLVASTDAPLGDWAWFRQNIPADERARVRAAIDHALAGRSLFELEHRVNRPDGTTGWTLSRAVPILDDAGAVVEWFGTATDITGRKSAEAQRQALLEDAQAARAEADRAGRMKDEFLATLSHELRTPLSAILGWSQILTRGTPRPDTLAEGLKTIERNARAQTQIIDDLLDMSRIISGKVALDPQRIDLGVVVRNAIDTVRAAASAKEIALRFESSPDARHPVVGDLNRLQQVFWNLLANAIKFTPKGGVVRVRVEARHSNWRVDVADTGEGIAPEFLPHVFDRFRQADASTTRRHGGLGLGLAIVKQLVELHGGRVAVRSDGPGAGSTFTVALPMSVLHAPAEPDRNGAADAALPRPMEVREGLAWDLDAGTLRGVTVLVVDDEPDARALLVRLLADQGATVLTAPDAAEAFETLQRDRPDVIVSDVGMPGEDGLSLLRRVRALAPDRGGRTPAIALTAYARAEDRVSAIRAGFHLHVPKPVEPAELVSTIDSLLARGRG